MYLGVSAIVCFSVKLSESRYLVADCFNVKPVITLVTDTKTGFVGATVLYRQHFPAYPQAHFLACRGAKALAWKT